MKTGKTKKNRLEDKFFKVSAKKKSNMIPASYDSALQISTKILRVHKKKDFSKIAEAANILKKGGLVAFPTETVYGLGANALDAQAVSKIFLAKGRPSDNPLIVHIGEKEDILKYAKNIPDTAIKLVKKFWPGPLTIVLTKRKNIPNNVTGNLNTVALRMPDHAVALELIRKSGIPIAAPSANLSGRPSPTKASHVISDLKNRIDVIISGEDTQVGLESTVIDLTRRKPMILRPGKITKEQLEKIIGNVLVYKNTQKASSKKIRSPGMKYTHYSPSAEVILVIGNKNAVEAKINMLIRDFQKEDKKIATIGTKKYQSNFSFVYKNKNDIAHNLFQKFREFDSKHADAIIIEGLDDKGLGLAIMNRVKKAADKIIEAY